MRCTIINSQKREINCDVIRYYTIKAEEKLIGSRELWRLSKSGAARKVELYASAGGARAEVNQPQVISW